MTRFNARILLPPIAVNSPLQEATAVGFEDAAKTNFFPQQIKEYAERRAVLVSALDELGLPYTMPDGAYFILMNNERIKIPDDFVIPDMVRMLINFFETAECKPSHYHPFLQLKNRPKDWHVSWFMAHTIGVVTIPASE